MPHLSTQSPEALAAVATFVSATKLALGDNLSAIALVGSSQRSTLTVGISDFDCSLYLHRPLTLEQATALQEAYESSVFYPYSKVDILNILLADQSIPLANRIVMGNAGAVYGNLPPEAILGRDNTAELIRRARQHLSSLYSQAGWFHKEWSTAVTEKTRHQVSVRVYNAIKNTIRAQQVITAADPFMAHQTPLHELYNLFQQLDPPLYTLLMEHRHLMESPDPEYRIVYPAAFAAFAALANRSVTL